jgi:hypothetical protein
MSTPIRPATDPGASLNPGSEMPPKPEQASLVEDFIDIFYAPSRVFARRATGGFFLVFLVVCAISAIFQFTSRSLTLAAAEADLPRIEAKMRENPQVTEDMIASMRKSATPGVSQYIATPIIILVLAFFVFAFARMVSAKISYGQAAMITSLAFIPRLLAGLLRTVEALLVDPTNVKGSLALTHSPARFMDSDTPIMTMALLSRFDVFVLWSTVLIAIGIAVMGNVSRTRGAIAAGILWLLGMLPLAGMSMMMK